MILERITLYYQKSTPQNPKGTFSFSQTPNRVPVTAVLPDGYHFEENVTRPHRKAKQDGIRCPNNEVVFDFATPGWSGLPAIEYYRPPLPEEGKKYKRCIRTTLDIISPLFMQKVMAYQYEFTDDEGNTATIWSPDPSAPDIGKRIAKRAVYLRDSIHLIQDSSTLEYYMERPLPEKLLAKHPGDMVGKIDSVRASRFGGINADGNLVVSLPTGNRIAKQNTDYYCLWVEKDDIWENVEGKQSMTYPGPIIGQSTTDTLIVQSNGTSHYKREIKTL